jgi:hypothetical protein
MVRVRCGGGAVLALVVCRPATAIYIVRERWWGCAGAGEVIAVMQNRQAGDVDLVKGYEEL